jgi:hypothetical protein
MNQSQEALFLAGLSLMMEGGNENEATLDEWNRDTLESGACILVHKDGRGRIQQLPAICPNDVVQELLIFPWADRFTVYYNGATAGDCDMKSEECSIFITGP